MTDKESNGKPRLLLLTGKLSYQARSFVEAARHVGADVLLGTDRCHQLDDPWTDSAIALHFEDPGSAAAVIAEKLAKQPVHGILALGDRPIETAAIVARSLGLPYNSPESAANCSSKLRQREILREAKLRVPDFFVFSLDEPLAPVLKRVDYPCVVKPLGLAASQGVIRANNEEEFVAAVERNRALLASPEIQVTREPDLRRLLVERYIPGGEVAVEALLADGKLHVLAIFDKPDPLEGPFFEETIYVTPSRLPMRVQRAIENSLRDSVAALGLTEGPIHAEFRIEDRTRDPWVLEIAPRPIGGLCSRTLRFGERLLSLEELLVRHALHLGGTAGPDLVREKLAAGVMMLPVPMSGILEKVEDVDKAAKAPGVESIEITARLHDAIKAWPEGSSYLGFIFARGETPGRVEKSLRRAHVMLRFTISPTLPVENAATRKLPKSASRRASTD